MGSRFDSQALDGQISHHQQRAALSMHPVSHTNDGILYVCPIRTKMRKHCFEMGGPPKDFLQESELVGLPFLTRPLSCLHGGQI